MEFNFKVIKIDPTLSWKIDQNLFCVVSGWVKIMQCFFTISVLRLVTRVKTANCNRFREVTQAK